MTTLIRSTILLLALTVALPSSSRAQEAISLANPSFELDPNGNSPCIQQNDFSGVNGWYTDTATVGSGVSENGNATDGVCAAWLQSDDSALWQVTDYTIQAGDTFTLQVDSRNSWIAYLVELTLFYEDGVQHVVGAQESFEVTDVMATFTLTFSADDVPASVGHKLGIAFDNISDPSSWVEVDNFRLMTGTVTAVERGETLPNGFVLEQNYPNPFNPETLIRYELSGAAYVRLEVYDLLGHHVATLTDDYQPAGTYAARWDGRNDAGVPAASGLYVYQMTFKSAGSTTTTAVSRTMLLLK